MIVEFSFDRNRNLTLKTVFGWIFLLLFGSLVNSISLADGQADYEREARLAQEAEAGLFEGDAVYLNDGKRNFLSLYSEASASSFEGAVILLHGRGFHPDWVQVAGPLREGFGELGITTLSLQMPVLAKNAKYYEYLEIIPQSFPRIEAGIDFLRSKGYQWIAVVAHSCSVHMTMAWIGEFGDNAFDAYVGIGMEATDYGQPMLERFPLERMSIPVLDVYGSEDYPAVIKGAERRISEIESAGNPQSMQIKIEGPDHFFEGYENELVTTVGEWIRQTRYPD